MYLVKYFGRKIAAVVEEMVEMFEQAREKVSGDEAELEATVKEKELEMQAFERVLEVVEAAADE